MHQTRDLNDGYMGSGKLIKRAINKYGVENFSKEILYVFDNKQDMINKEKELVVVCEDSYNLNAGGQGGFDYINSNKEICLKKNKKARIAADKVLIEKYGSKWRTLIGKKGQEIRSNMYPNFYTDLAKRGHEEGWLNWSGKKHKPQSILLIKEKKKGTGLGKDNSQYGTCWITNGKENKKIKKEELNLWSTKGYYKGRVIRQ